MKHGKSERSAKRAKPAARSSSAREIASLQEKLKRVEQERDVYARELARRLAKDFDPGEVNEDEWNDILKNGSEMSLEVLARQIAKDAEQ